MFVNIIEFCNFCHYFKEFGFIVKRDHYAICPLFKFNFKWKDRIWVAKIFKLKLKNQMSKKRKVPSELVFSNSCE